MDQENDLSYYRRRELGARQMAAHSSDWTIKAIHTAMADRYAAKIRQISEKPILTIVT